MILKHFSIINYKNFESKTFDFNSKINCFVGNNGVGKTNILDAIYHLSFGKSYFNAITGQNIKHGHDFFVIEGNYLKADKEERIIVSAKRNQKKIIKRNGKVYPKFADHIGFLPLVIISPADSNLITEGSDLRRKFIDGIISQGDKNYLATLLKYNKVLVQRNSLLKYFALNNTSNHSTLDIYNQQLHELGTLIFEARKQFLDVFLPIFEARHKVISNDKESAKLIYNSQLFDAPLLNLLEDNVQKDKILQYTSKGVHKDDLILEIGDYPIKKFGSQGQQKSYLIALKLAQFDFLKQQKGVNPILLLDDIFDKLDEQRVEQLLKLVDQDAFGQIFISDTHADRTENIIKNVHQSYEMFSL